MLAITIQTCTFASLYIWFLCLQLLTQPVFGGGPQQGSSRLPGNQLNQHFQSIGMGSTSDQHHQVARKPLNNIKSTTSNRQYVLRVEREIVAVGHWKAFLPSLTIPYIGQQTTQNRSKVFKSQHAAFASSVMFHTFVIFCVLVHDKKSQHRKKPNGKEDPKESRKATFLMLPPDMAMKLTRGMHHQSSSNVMQYLT